MFERFTERARQAVVLAQDEARRLRHNYIGSEHLLLGLLREEEGLAARVLEGFDVDVEGVRRRVAGVVGTGDEVVAGQIPFTPRAKTVLELALREALSLSHNYIGTEHILLGLLREADESGGGVASGVLRDLGVEANAVREALISMLAAPGRMPPRGRPERSFHVVGGGVPGGAPTPVVWEYHVRVAEDLDAVSEGVLNELGTDGWELVAAAGGPGAYRLFFKRPRAEPPPAIA